MTYQLSPARSSHFERILPQLLEAREVILTTHLNADGDGTGCEAALLEFFAERGIEAWIVNPTPFPDAYRFLVGDPERILDAGSSEATQRCFAADLCVVVDTGEVHRLGRVKPMVEALPKIVIDHHPVGDRPIEGDGIRDPSAAAAGELVFELLHLAGGPWTRPVVEGLYAAILTDTGSFRFSNSTAGAHRVVGELIERGADPELIHRQLYGSVPIRRHRLLERSLPSLAVSEDGSVAWMTVNHEAFRDLDCMPEDIDGLVDFPREVTGVEVALLFRELPEGGTKVSFRSNGEVDVNRVAGLFEGGGHVRASGAFIQAPEKEVRPRVVQATLDAVHERLPPDGTAEGDGA